MSSIKARSMVLAIGAVAITAAGAYTGANYKTEVEKQGIRKEYMTETTEQKIARLESQRAIWMTKKDELEKKMKQLDEKIENKKRKEAGSVKAA